LAKVINVKWSARPISGVEERGGEIVFKMFKDYLAEGKEKGKGIHFGSYKS